VMARQGVPYHVATHVRVVDGDMSDVPADGETMGEVVMRGNNVMKGYFEDPEATAEAFRGGWFHSGDLGVIQHIECNMCFPNALFLKPSAWRAMKDEAPAGGLAPLDDDVVAIEDAFIALQQQDEENAA